MRFMVVYVILCGLGPVFLAFEDVHMKYGPQSSRAELAWHAEGSCRVTLRCRMIVLWR